MFGQWDTTPRDIRADLEAFKESCIARLRDAGYKPVEICASGRQLIGLYRLGFLRPDDDSVRILIPDADREMVEAYLRDEHQS